MIIYYMEKYIFALAEQEREVKTTNETLNKCMTSSFRDYLNNGGAKLEDATFCVEERKAAKMALNKFREIGKNKPASI